MLNHGRDELPLVPNQGLHRSCSINGTLHFAGNHFKNFLPFVRVANLRFLAAAFKPLTTRLMDLVT